MSSKVGHNLKCHTMLQCHKPWRHNSHSRSLNITSWQDNLKQIRLLREKSDWPTKQNSSPGNKQSGDCERNEVMSKMSETTQDVAYRRKIIMDALINSDEKCLVHLDAIIQGGEDDQSSRWEISHVCFLCSGRAPRAAGDIIFFASLTYCDTFLLFDDVSRIGSLKSQQSRTSSSSSPQHNKSAAPFTPKWGDYDVMRHRYVAGLHVLAACCCER